MPNSSQKQAEIERKKAKILQLAAELSKQLTEEQKIELFRQMARALGLKPQTRMPMPA